MYGMMEIRAENSYKRLKRELDCCPYITGIEREWLTAYLLQHRIVSLNEIDLKKEMEYRSFVWDSEEIVESKSGGFSRKLCEIVERYQLIIDLEVLPDFTSDEIDILRGIIIGEYINIKKG